MFIEGDCARVFVSVFHYISFGRKKKVSLIYVLTCLYSYLHTDKEVKDTDKEVKDIGKRSKTKESFRQAKIAAYVRALAYLGDRKNKSKL